MSAPLSTVSATRARDEVYLCIPGNRGECSVHLGGRVKCGRLVELIDGHCFERRQPGRPLPQLPRFGMSVAQGYF
jgi:hypothetical protein